MASGPQAAKVSRWPPCRRCFKKMCVEIAFNIVLTRFLVSLRYNIAKCGRNPHVCSGSTDVNLRMGELCLRTRLLGTAGGQEKDSKICSSEISMRLLFPENVIRTGKNDCFG